MTHELILNDDQLAVLQLTNMQPAQMLRNFLLSQHLCLTMLSDSDGSHLTCALSCTAAVAVAFRTSIILISGNQAGANQSLFCTRQ